MKNSQQPTERDDKSGGRLKTVHRAIRYAVCHLLMFSGLFVTVWIANILMPRGISAGLSPWQLASEMLPSDVADLAVPLWPIHLVLVLAQFGIRRFYSQRVVPALATVTLAFGILLQFVSTGGLG